MDIENTKSFIDLDENRDEVGDLLLNVRFFKIHVFQTPVQKIRDN